MEKFVAELKKRVPFKNTTAAGDIVLIASHEPQMLVYALVTGIEPDKGRKKAWWNVTLQILAVPPGEVVWTLREAQFTGEETFSFNGIVHFMKAVRFASSPSPAPPVEDGGKESSGASRGRLRVIK